MPDFSIKNTHLAIDGSVVTDELELYKWSYNGSATIRITTYSNKGRASTTISLSKNDVKNLLKNLKNANKPAKP